MMDLMGKMYDWSIRPWLPRKVGVYNGVPVRNLRLFDRIDEYSEYEQSLIDAIRTRVSPGDTVVIVGGGFGVSSIVAARIAGSEGQVITFEGARDRHDLLGETARLNKVHETITYHHAVVGEEIHLLGKSKGAPQVSPSNLPECDVLVMDCEGAEISILTEYNSRPHTTIVETHGFLGAPENIVRKLLAENEYRVINRAEEDPEREVIVLTAVSSA